MADTYEAILLVCTRVSIYKTSEGVGFRTLLVLERFEPRNPLSIRNNHKRTQKLLQTENCSSRKATFLVAFKHSFGRNELEARVTETLYRRGLCLP